jgi:hypothetical protein
MMPFQPAARVRSGIGRVVFAVAVTAGLLAVGVPAALASPQPVAAPHAAAAVSTAATTCTPVVGQINPCTAKPYPLPAPYTGCTLWVGDRYEGTNGAAVGEAVVSCPTPHTYRMLVYLDYHDYANGQEYTYQENVQGTPYYNYDAYVATGCATNVWAYWTTYARISIDGHPYSGFYKSDSNKYYSAGSSCR